MVIGCCIFWLFTDWLLTFKVQNSQSKAKFGTFGKLDVFDRLLVLMSAEQVVVVSLQTVLFVQKFSNGVDILFGHLF